MIGQGGADLSLTAKVASVKRFSPADRAGLEKMDYVWTVNGKEVSSEYQYLKLANRSIKICSRCLV